MAIKLPDLGKQVGPLPLGAWVIVVGAGLGFAYYSRSDGDVGLASDTELEDTSIPPGVGEGTGSFIPALPVADTGGESPEEPVDNEEWVRDAVQKMLVGSGYNPIELINALTAYINSKPLTARQKAIVNEAIRTAGAPPFPVASTTQPRPPVPGVIPKPAPKPAPKPVPRRYTVRRGQTLGEIARKFDISRARLFQLNHQKLDRIARRRTKHRDSNGGRILFPGTVLRLR